MAAKRYALVGTGSRGIGMFGRPLLSDFPGRAELAALCDSNPLRLAAAAAQMGASMPLYTDFREMMRKTNPDGVIVASRDCTHAQYVVAALKAGKRVICEKPLCVSAAQCRRILSAAAGSLGRCLVTHNVRYGAADTRIREIIRSGKIGRVLFVQFDETLDRSHGADYFRRWHRQMANSGGLLVHKASHHFDIMNWWIGSKPEWVSAQGRLAFYGANGPFHHTRCAGCPHAARCDFHADLFRRDADRQLYREAEAADGYLRDGCVFDPGIDIYDQMSALIEYASGVQASYTLTAYSPYESQRTVIEGTKGRLEYSAAYNTGWIAGGHPLPGMESIVGEHLRLYVPGRGIETVPIQRQEGSHGGADPQLRADFFSRPWNAKPTAQMASLEEAVQAVLIGAAANRSIASGRPVKVQSLLGRRA